MKWDEYFIGIYDLFVILEVVIKLLNMVFSYVIDKF